MSGPGPRGRPGGWRCTLPTRPVSVPCDPELHTLYIPEASARLSSRDGRLVVETDAGAAAHVVVELREVVVHARAHLSSGARGLLLSHGVDTVFLDDRGRLAGRLHAHRQANVPRRFAQLRLLADPARRLELARAIVADKLDAQLACLASASRVPAVRAARAAIADGRARLGEADTLDRLRGLEGAAAARGFEAFAARLGDVGFSWVGRVRHPATDPLNAALGFGYALAKSTVERAVLLASLDPCVGVLHASTRGAPALVLDLVEPLRPRVEGLLVALVNRRTLRPSHFEPPAEDGAVMLTPDGRRVLVTAWSEALAETEAHPITRQRWRRADLVTERVEAFARALGPDALDEEAA